MKTKHPLWLVVEVTDSSALSPQTVKETSKAELLTLYSTLIGFRVYYAAAKKKSTAMILLINVGKHTDDSLLA